MLSIILLVYKEAHKTIECINRILSLTDVPFELIIIDNNAEKEIKDFIYNLKDDRIIFHTNKENEGIAKSYNLGAKIARGEYLAYVNSDYYLTNEWASQMIKCLEETKAGMIGPMCNATGNFDQLCYNQYYIPLRYIETDYITNLMFMKKSVLKEVGYFDENYNPYLVDDVDLVEAIKKAGYKIFVDGFTFHWHDYNQSKEDENFIKVRDKNWEYFRKKWGDKIFNKYQNKAK